MSAARIALALSFALSAFSAQPTLSFEFLKMPAPQCDSPNILATLKERVDGRFRSVNKTKLYIKKVVQARMTYERQKDELHRVGRKFCHGVALMGGGGSRIEKRDIWYTLSTPQDLAGIPGVAKIDFCITGLDAWRIYGKDCSTLRTAIGW